MSRNVEIKARLENKEILVKRITSLGYKYYDRIRQKDIYFQTVRGRLKLRIENSQRAELIYYVRPDSNSPKLSDYYRYPVNDPDSLRKMFEKAFGIRGEVDKTRTVYFSCQTRIHIDAVSGLGDFLELETILEDDQSVEEGQKTCLKILSELGIKETDLIPVSYIDLIND